MLKSPKILGSIGIWTHTIPTTKSKSPARTQPSPFNRGGHPRPYHGGEEFEMKTHMHEISRLPEIPEMSVDENTPLLVGEERTYSERLFGTGQKKTRHRHRDKAVHTRRVPRS